VTTRILAVAVNTVRRKMHERLLYIFLMFVFALIAGSVLISKLTLGDGGRLILNLGIAAVNLFGVFMAVFVGMALVHDEIEKKTLYAVLSKPVSRQEFVLGKFFGLVTTLSIVVWLMASALLLVLYAMAVPVTLVLIKCLVLMHCELLLVAALAFVFSTFTTPTLAALFTFALYVAGHLTADLKELAAGLEGVTKMAVLSAYYTIPNLERLNFKAHALHQIDPGTVDMVLALMYGCAYLFLLLVTAVMIFNRRELL